MKILHTSDWHLGQNFMNRSRREEHGKFLAWLIQVINGEEIDILLVSGDLFDTGNPPNYALELYYNFLMEVSKTRISSVVITAGNHDSVSNIEAPRELLKLLNIEVKGAIDRERPGRNIVEVKKDGDVICYVCAVPFIRERDVRISVGGESYDDRNKAFSEGFKGYYRDICDEVLKRKGLKKIPVVGMGHTFAAGCKTSEGEREIFIGNIAKITTKSFPSEFDYLAMGHLHNPQKADDNGLICYSGSPVPLSFSELKYKKRVVVIDFKDFPESAKIKDIEVPEFQKLVRIKGSKTEVLSELNNMEEGVWVEVIIVEDIPDPSFMEEISDVEKAKNIEVLAVKRGESRSSLSTAGIPDVKTLDDLTPYDVFERRVEDINIDERDILRKAFDEVLTKVENEDS